MNLVLPEAIPKTLKVREADSNQTDEVPVERRADLVLQLGEDKEATHVVVEVQLRIDPAKRYRWPRYAASIHDHMQQPAVVLVITSDEEVAAWARAPIPIGGRSVFYVEVLGPEAVPKITTVEAAVRSPELAMLSLLMYRDAPEAFAIALVVGRMLTHLSDDQATFYYDQLQVLLSEEMGKEVTTMLTQEKPRFYSKVMQDNFNQGEMKGETKGKVEMLTKLLQKRFGPLDANVETKIQNASLETLTHWFDRGLDVDTLDVVFAED